MIIAVWGNNGSGKSTLAIKLALSLISQKKDVLLVDADYSAPQINVWYPKLNVQPSQSLAVLLENNITIDSLTNKIHVLKSNLCVMGYAKDYSSNAVPGRSDTAEELFQIFRTRDFRDYYIIIDCMSCPITDFVSYEALLNFDALIVAYTPDLKGMSWYDSNVKMFEEGWKNNNRKVIRAFNQTQITAPVNNIESALGPVQYYIPYDKALKEEMYAGTLGKVGHKHTARIYSQVVDTIAHEILERE